MICNKVTFDRKDLKYFIGYKDDDKTNPFCTMLPKMSGYAKSFDKFKYDVF